MRYESVARLLISGPQSLQELRIIARQFERELLARGIDRIEIRGLPQDSVQISIPSTQMRRLGLGLDELASRIDNASQDLPAGLMGEDDGTREIRSMSQRRTPLQFEELSIISERDRRITIALEIIAENKGKGAEPSKAFAEEIARRYATVDLTDGELAIQTERMYEFLRTKAACEALAPFKHKFGNYKTAAWVYEDRSPDGKGSAAVRTSQGATGTKQGTGE